MEQSEPAEIKEGWEIREPLEVQANEGTSNDRTAVFDLKLDFKAP